MNEERLDVLLYKYLSNTITASELDEFLLLIAECDDEILDFKLNCILDVEFNHFPVSKRRENIFKTITNSENKSHIYRSRWKDYLKVAAIIFILSFLGTVYYYHVSKLSRGDYTVINKQDIVVEDEKVKLHLNGSNDTIVLSESVSDFDLGDLSFRIDSSGALSYSLKDDHQSLPITIETPKGRDMYLKLIDGSEVWLNSNSKITFNPRLGASIREVSLVGEGYFEVKSDKKRPFIVKTNKSSVQVVGTAFNVSAYLEDTHEKTTLIRGKVIVDNRVEMSPNDQYVLNHITNTGKLFTDIDVSEAVAWKFDNFEFNQRDINEVLDLLSKWYPIKSVIYKKESHDTFTGTFKRSRSLRSVLDQLEVVSNYDFEIKDGSITVK